MTLSQSQLRLISSIGIGILVGTSLIVIIPEGIEAIATTSGAAHSHSTRHFAEPRSSTVRWEKVGDRLAESGGIFELEARAACDIDSVDIVSRQLHPASVTIERAEDKDGQKQAPTETPATGSHENQDEHEDVHMPTFYIGFSLILGFVLMFLIDRLPRHATESLQGGPTTRHISLDNLATSNVSGEEESEGFLNSLTPTPKQSRSLATTTGLVIHAAADGIAMGASASTSNTKLGLIIFVAIMVHKAPAAFGLTSVLLKQGLSKRAARGHLIVFSLAAPFGALSTYLIISLIGGDNMEGDSGQWWTGMLLLFSAGTFLYVAMHAMQEDNSQGHEHHSSMNGYADNSQRRQSKPQMRDTLATAGGMLLPLLTQFGHHH
ncbi:ZIP zinc transporter-domain-containing protein [Podospora appendiculata]|uniref:ZIP zinc transporter-domain-containing protein n=1 Tax=Podospora appendiculata TaxID=314037 RepID=A0AAE0X1E4_9PEZI|nr:ZIP zinc transporter-domain-containing protein [Podospora appendiculata]